MEDALEATGHAVGRASKWAKRSGGGGGGKRGNGGGKDDDGGGAMLATAPGGGTYSEQTRQSLANVDESLINTDLIEALVAHLAATRAAQQAQQGGGKRRGAGDDANAILIFAPGEAASCVCVCICRCVHAWGVLYLLFSSSTPSPISFGLPPPSDCLCLPTDPSRPAGADEISRICRTLSASGRVAAAAGGGGVLVLPLHGGLPPSQQSRVFNRPPKGERRGSPAWLVPRLCHPACKLQPPASYKHYKHHSSSPHTHSLSLLASPSGSPTHARAHPHATVAQPLCCRPTPAALPRRVLLQAPSR